MMQVEGLEGNQFAGEASLKLAAFAGMIQRDVFEGSQEPLMLLATAQVQAQLAIAQELRDVRVFLAEVLADPQPAQAPADEAPLSPEEQVEVLARELWEAGEPSRPPRFEDEYQRIQDQYRGKARTQLGLGEPVEPTTKRGGDRS